MKNWSFVFGFFFIEKQVFSFPVKLVACIYLLKHVYHITSFWQSIFTLSKHTWWRLFQKHVVCIKLDIYIFNTDWMKFKYLSNPDLVFLRKFFFLLYKSFICSFQLVVSRSNSTGHTDRLQWKSYCRRYHN